MIDTKDKKNVLNVRNGRNKIRKTTYNICIVVHVTEYSLIVTQYRQEQGWTMIIKSIRQYLNIRVTIVP